MAISPKPLLGTSADTPSRLPRPTSHLLNTPMLNDSTNSTPYYRTSKIPRPQQGVKQLPPIPFSVDSLKPLPTTPAETPKRISKPAAPAPQKRFTARLPSRITLGQPGKSVSRESSQRSLTTRPTDYAHVKNLKESSAAGSGPTLRISEDAEDIIFGPSDTVWSNVTAKLKLKSSPSSSKRVSANSVKRPSDVAFGHPVWFEDSMSEESGSLTSTKVARHRNKALDHLEGRKGPCSHKAGEPTYADTAHLSTLSDNPEEDDCSAAVPGSSGSDQEDNKQDDKVITLVRDSSDERNSGSSVSSSRLIKSAAYARTARQIEVTSHLKAVRKVSNLRKTASSQAVGAPQEPTADVVLPEPVTETASPAPVTEIKLISLTEARERERHASKMRAIKLVSTSSLSEPSPSPLALHTLPQLGAPAKRGDAKPKRRLSKIPVYAMFSDMVSRRREKREKPKPQIRPLIITSPKRISPSTITPVRSAVNRQNKYQKLPPTPPLSPPATIRKTPMDRHKDMMVYASNLRQDARLVASQMADTATKLELLRTLELFNDTVMNSANALAAAESARVASLQARMYWESTHRAVQNSQELLYGQVHQALRLTSSSA